MCAAFFNAAAVFCTGLVVKTMDDLLDEEDLLSIPYFARLGSGLAPYTLALFSLASAFNFRLSFGLFWASYCLGMIKSPFEKLPTGLRANTEVILGIILMLLVIGARKTFWSVLIMAAVQLIDDFLDFKEDQIVKAANAALVLGRVECFLTALIFFYPALNLLPWESLFSWCFALVIGNGRIFRRGAPPWS
ncbi:MAG: hypothetical protein GX335_08215 [Firmicutes bacterium]|nr:hypothetical protein [Bacillota bacterium]